MKKVNVPVSTLYNFTDEGAFPETCLGLYGITTDQAVEAFEHGLSDSLYDSADHMFQMAKDYIFIDRLNWLSELSRLGYCPQCNYSKAGYLLPDLQPPYVHYLPEFSYDEKYQRQTLLGKNILKLIENPKIQNV